MSQNLNTLPFKVIYEDPNLVVLDKPAGLLSQGDASGEENLVDLLRGYFGRHYVGLVHRLDRNTSGVMVVAKRSKAAERLTQALQGGTLTRVYLGVLEGSLQKSARWEHFLDKDPAQNLTRVYLKPGPDRKKAVLFVKPIEALPGNCTLAEFKLETGRSHQIRAQCAFEGHPLLGDPKYGTPNSKIKRPALHSWKIAFPHPISKEQLEFIAEFPKGLLP